MAKKTSAGLLVYRRGPSGLEVLVVHPGGPIYARKDEGVWSLPKGEHGPEEAPLDAARREFTEETGFPTADDLGAYLPLGEVSLASGKVVSAFAVEGDVDPEKAESGTFEMEWPPRSGLRQAFPEVDRAAFLSLAAARRALHPAQVPFLERLERALAETAS